MPQIEQLPEIFWSQLFWLLLVFGIVYFAIGRGMLPKIQSVVDKRERKITEDLAAAQRAREEADAAEDAYRDRLDASRSEALKLTQSAKQEAAIESEKRVRAADEQIGARTSEAEARIQGAVNEALRELEPIAAEAAAQLVVKLTGQPVAPDEARPAVKAVLNG